MACDPGLFFDAAANGYFLVCAAPIGIQADAAVTRFTLEFLCIFEQFHAHDFICRDDARQLFSGGVFTHRAHSLDADTGHQQLHQLPNCVSRIINIAFGTQYAVLIRQALVQRATVELSNC